MFKALLRFFDIEPEFLVNNGQRVDFINDQMMMSIKTNALSLNEFPYFNSYF
jgi:hypothetical protein